MEIDDDIDGNGGSSSYKNNVESEEFCALLRQQKYLNSLTEHALRKNQPLIISNLIRDKDCFSDHNISGISKLEQTCLQALSMYVIPGSSHVEIPIDEVQEEEQKVRLSTGKGGASAISGVVAIPDSDLPMIVSYAFELEFSCIYHVVCVVC